MGFSGSSYAAGGYASAFYAGRYGTSPTGAMTSSLLIHQGNALFTAGVQGNQYLSRFGDYSGTTLDPNDYLSFWTIQEIGDNAVSSSYPWGTWAVSIQLR